MTSTEPAGHADLVLRPGVPADGPAVAAVFLEARRAAVPAMPAPVWSDQEAADVVAERLDRPHELWVAEDPSGAGGAVVGFVDLEHDWLDALYVRPGWAGRGVGTALLDLVKALRPGGFALWVFESNEPARRFYRRHGLVELEHTDGSGNEERSPDLRMAWPGEDPMTYLRSQVDEVDDELAVLLARRAALTAAIQRFKPVPGHAGRDPEREAAIAARMAARAPGLDVETWRRIMHEVITASLDAAEGSSPP